MKHFSWIAALAALAASCALPPTEAERELASAKATISARLIDPTTPIFTDVVQRPGKICGYVNAKNRLGAYAGKKRFVWSPTAATIEPDRYDVTVVPVTECGFEAEYQGCLTGRNITDDILACARAAYTPREK